MPTKKKVQCPIRLYPDHYAKIREKAELDGLNFQKVSEALFGAYLKNNKDIMKIVKKFAEDNGAKKKKGELTDIERDELLRIIEDEYSPLKDLDNIIQEIDDEQSDIQR
jgi:predicted DNA binding CopG/RHH family protein